MGGFVSQNSRNGFWGSNAIETIAALLQKEMPGLRGFSVSNIKNMRIFYEEWHAYANRQLPTAEFPHLTGTTPGGTEKQNNFCKNVDKKMSGVWGNLENCLDGF